MAKSLDEFVSQSPPTNPSLPLMHVTDGFAFRTIIIEKALKPYPCKVFSGENLVYFSYGRPALKPHGDELPSALLSLAPVCFILNNKNISPAKVAPFDTGAFMTGRFRNAMHPRMSVNSFVLRATKDKPQRIVNAFFESNVQYLDGKARVQPQVDALSFEVESFFTLLTNKSSNNYDDRVCAIEIASATAVNLNSNLIGLVCPQEFADDPQIIEASQAMNFELCPYSVGARLGGQAYAGSVALRARDFLSSHSLI